MRLQDTLRSQKQISLKEDYEIKDSFHGNFKLSNAIFEPIRTLRIHIEGMFKTLYRPTFVFSQKYSYFYRCLCTQQENTVLKETRKYLGDFDWNFLFIKYWLPLCFAPLKIYISPQRWRPRKRKSQSLAREVH